jgi:hypothetical protein
MSCAKRNDRAPASDCAIEPAGEAAPSRAGTAGRIAFLRIDARTSEKKFLAAEAN